MRAGRVLHLRLGIIFAKFFKFVPPTKKGNFAETNFAVRPAAANFAARAETTSADTTAAGMNPQERYETIVGLEVHVQLSTRSKAFCGDDASFGGEPNTRVSPVSLGHPGTLPRLNARQVECAVRLGLALGCEINLRSRFDRKHYFYTDLPKGYQITQDAEPICRGGALPIRIGSEWKSVGIHHIHMEEDAGKSIHDQDPRHSLIDLNRAGVPLLEIVTEPDLRSPEEVNAFMSAMRQLVRWLGISDGNMQEGSLRCDVNVSVRKKGSTALGQRCEVKNLNSMRFARKAIEYEVRRQIALLEKGGRVGQTTLHFDPRTGRTSPLRDKEDAHDYRYFPDPDLPPVVLELAYVEGLRAALPPLPWELFRRMVEDFSLKTGEAEILTAERPAAELFFQLAAQTPDARAAAGLLVNKVLPWAQEHDCPLDSFPLPVQRLASFLELVHQGKVSTSIAYQRLFPACLQHPDQDPETLAQTLNLLQSKDADFLQTLVGQVLERHPDKVLAYRRKGKKGLLGFFMGELMRASKGKADPQAANALLRRALEEEG